MAHVDSSARLSGDMYPHTMKKYFKVKGVTRNILVGGVRFFLPIKKRKKPNKLQILLSSIPTGEGFHTYYIIKHYSTIW
jgi:hypothetical protein